MSPRKKKSQPKSSEKPIVRVGIDLGAHTTVVQTAGQLSELLLPKTTHIPTWLAYINEPDAEDRVAIGDAALSMRHEVLAFNPLQRRNRRALRDYAARLRSVLDPRSDKELWGVVSVQAGANEESVELVRLFAQELFDRTRLMNDALLMATSFGSRDVARKSIWIDLGADATRLCAVQGSSSSASEESVLLPGGGAAITARLNEHLTKRFPGLIVTPITGDQLKERFAHVSPANAVCPLRVLLDDVTKDVDIANIVRRACEPLVSETLSGIERVVANCPSDSIEEFLGHIVVSGGGARIPGLAARLQDGVRDMFGTHAVVQVPSDPACLVANGALRWAHFTEEDDWEVSLFSFA